MQVCGVCVCEYMCMYICMCVCINVKTCDKISSTDTSRKELCMTCSSLTISKRNKNISTAVGSVYLISSAEDPEQKWLYWNPWNSRSGHPTMSPITWFTIFNLSPYLQLQDAKLNLSNFIVTSPFNTEINYTCICWHSSLE